MKLKRILTTVLGFVALSFGLIGIFLPLLPTTPFVLLAAFCFSYSSRRFYDWLKQSLLFGAYIENYYIKQGIAVSLKIKSLLALWLSLIFSMLLLQTVWAYIGLSVVGIGISVHLLLLKTKGTACPTLLLEEGVN